MPEDYYIKIDMIQNLLRQKDNNSAYSSASLIPIPGHQLYNELLRKWHNDNQIFKEEIKVGQLE